MRNPRRVLYALALACSLAAMPVAAQTQAPAQPASSGFDVYRVLAVTAGIAIGAAVAIVVTDGLILPAYAYMTGTAVEAGAAAGTGMAAAEAGAATGAGASGATGAAGAGAGAAGPGILHRVGSSLMEFGHSGFSSAMGLLGGAFGGLYADSWYQGN